MGCHCGQKPARPTAPRYLVTGPDGVEVAHMLYVDARRDVLHRGGTLKEIR